MRKPHPKSRPFKTGSFTAGQDRHDASHSGTALTPPSTGKAAMLYGIHPVTAAWLNPDRSCRHLYATAPALAAFGLVWERAHSLGLKRPAPVIVERDMFDRLLPIGAVHQGLALEGDLPEVNLDDVLIAAGDGPLSLVMLDQVTDPHNVGAILRSAAAFGAKGMIVQTRHAPEITGVLAKAASGAVDAVPILRETNLARAIEKLRNAGVFILGMAEAGTCGLANANLTSRITLVLGAEGVGMRRLVTEGCDLIASLPTQPPISSLNVSNAAAVGLYEIARRRDQ